MTDQVEAREPAQRVLIVDDEYRSRRMMKAMLEAAERRFEIKEAASGEEAIKLIRAFRPDLILLDVVMPEPDGLSVCRELKGKPDTRQIKILVVTARTDNRIFVTAMQSGADEYIMKPFSQEQLLSCVERLLTE